MSQAINEPLTAKLSELVCSYRGIMSVEMAQVLGSSEMRCVDQGGCNAHSRLGETRNLIVVSSGLIDAVRFYSCLIKMLDIQGSQVESDADQKRLADFSDAAFVALMNSIKTGEPLADLDASLPENLLEESILGFEAALIFMLCHEAAHLILGHERFTYCLARRFTDIQLEEPLNKDKELELEADEYAYNAINEDLRELMFSSIVFFLGPLAFKEAFTSGSATTHPLAANRLARIASFIKFDQDAGARAAVNSIVEAELARYRRLKVYRQETEHPRLQIQGEIFPTD